MEPTSPLSIFEAVFKVIEERMPFGRYLVTIMSALMMAVLIVFCVGYLIHTLGGASIWILASIKARSFVPLLHFRENYESTALWVVTGIALVSMSMAVRQRIAMRQVSVQMNNATTQIRAIADSLNRSSTNLNQAVSDAKKRLNITDKP